MLFHWLTNWVRLPATPEPDWEPLRLTLVRRSLLALAPILLVHAAFGRLLGRGLGPERSGLVLGLLLAVLLHFKPSHRRPALWAAALLAGAAALLRPAALQGMDPRSAVLYLGLLGSLGLILDGPALGSALFLLSVVLDVQIVAAAPPGGVGRAQLGITAGLGAALFVSTLGWRRALSRGQAELLGDGAALARLRDERRRLTLALFRGLHDAAARLRAVAGDTGPVDWAALRAETRRVQEQAMKFRDLRDSFGAPAPATDRGSFARGVMAAMLGAGLLLSAAGTAAWWITRAQGRPWHGPFGLLVLGAAALGLRGRRGVPPWLAWTVVAAGPVIFLADVAAQWGSAVPTSLAYFAFSILGAGLLLGWRPAVAMTALAFAAVLASASSVPSLPPGELLFALDLPLAWCVVLLVCLHAMVWQWRLLESLEAGRRRLAGGLQLRRRLLGTLFHDVANPVSALLGLAELAQAGLGGAGEEARARRLVGRLLELLEGNRDWVLREDADARALTPVKVEDLAAAMDDLYSDGLAEKRLHFTADVPAGLAVLAQPAVLRDSVLSNLVNNGIKFSRPGGSLELEAAAEGGRVRLELRDRGPGVAAFLRAALEGGEDIPSLAGTAGEAGQGLGLGLAREHLRRMGGSLELAERDGGGTVVRLWLARA